MNCTYTIGEKKYKAYYWFSDDGVGVSTLSIAINNKKSIERTVRIDENGEYFTWDKHKIYTIDYEKFHIKKLKKLLEKEETSKKLCEDDFIKAIIMDGVDNVRFLVPTRYDRDNKKVICRIKEGYNCTVIGGYKIELVNVSENTPFRKDFYTSDLFSLVKDGIVEILDSVGDWDVDHTKEYFNKFRQDRK